MNVSALKLTNFRGFKNLELGFNDRINIFLGLNGAGKTSILDAISMNINHGIARLSTSNEKGEFFPEHFMTKNDVHFSAKDCTNELTYILDKKEVKYSLKQNIFETGFSYLGDAFSKYFLDVQNTINHETNLPLVVYYNAQQNYEVKFNDRKKEERFKQLNAYKNACNKRLFSFYDFNAWFKEQEDIENEVRLRQNPNFKLRELSIVRDAIRLFLNKLQPNILNETYSDLAIIRAKPLDDDNFNFDIKSEGELFIKKNGNFIKLEQLSDGEKKLILVVADIASRIAQLNPSLENPLENAKGIILFDELEQHLHPAWQRTIIHALSTTFSQIQWFFTTHSETVVVSLLDQIQDHKINSQDVNFYFIYDKEGVRNVETRLPNEFGQLEGGLKDFYIDVLESEVNPFA
jgi:predicted ATP-binding protein involved in virulence